MRKKVLANKPVSLAGKLLITKKGDYLTSKISKNKAAIYKLEIELVSKLLQLNNEKRNLQTNAILVVGLFWQNN